MGEYEAHIQVLNIIKNEILNLRSKIEGSMADPERNMMYRERYIAECNKWLVASDGLRQFIINCRERTEQQLRYFRGEEKCEKCKCREQK